MHNQVYMYLSFCQLCTLTMDDNVTGINSYLCFPSQNSIAIALLSSGIECCSEILG